MINCTFSVTGKYQSNFCQLEMMDQTPSTAHCCIVSIHRSNDWSYIYCYMYMYLKVNFNGIINNKKVSSMKRLSRKFIHMYCKYFSCCKRVGSFGVNYSCIITDELFVLYYSNLCHFFNPSAMDKFMKVQRGSENNRNLWWRQSLI